MTPFPCTVRFSTLILLAGLLVFASACGDGIIEDGIIEDMRLAIHFKPPADWPTPPTVHYWAEDLPGTSWPGTAMVAEGNGWYGLELGEIGEVGVVFSTSNGDRQSADYRFKERGWFVPSMEVNGRWVGQWYERNPDLIAHAPANAFRVANSWGVGGWEKVPDGYYWITFDAVRQAKKFYAVFYEPQPVREPTHLLVLGLAHPQRGRIRIDISVEGTSLAKSWPNWNVAEGDAGAHPLIGSERIAIDLSEFAAALPGRVLRVAITNQVSGGTVDSLALERHTAYSFTTPAPAETAAYQGGLPVALSNTGTLVLYLSNAGDLAPAAAPPPTSGAVLDSLVESVAADEAAFVALRQVVGTAEPGRSYNTVIEGFGTGLRPPSEAEWAGLRQRLRIARRVAPGVVRNPRAAATGVDLSASPHFPPIGNQGAKGSCSAWAMGYYMGTFLEARQRGRDLSKVAWDGSRPDRSRHWILSPQFLYVQLNNGDNSLGSSPFAIAELIAGIGAASWETCPYYDSIYDHLWPSETAWREAAMYRGTLDHSEGKWGTPHFIFFEDFPGYDAPTPDEMLELLRTLLQNGIPVMVAIDAYQYPKLSRNDVWTAAAYQQNSFGNHANTLVGYGAVTP